MILCQLNTVADRVHDPKRAFAPTSGAGAGKHGGRANRLAPMRFIFHWNWKLRL
jgi:RES domain-containing protein